MYQALGADPVSVFHTPRIVAVVSRRKTARAPDISGFHSARGSAHDFENRSRQGSLAGSGLVFRRSTVLAQIQVSELFQAVFGVENALARPGATGRDVFGEGLAR